MNALAGPALAWSVVLPVAGAAGCLMLGWTRGRLAAVWALAVAGVTCVVVLVPSVVVARSGPVSFMLGGWAAPYGIELRMDEFGAVMGFAAPVFALSVVFGVWLAADSFKGRREALYHALVLLNLGGILGFSLAGDIFNLFVAMEIFSLSAYALVTYGEKTSAAAFRYLIMGALSSLLVLFAIGLVYQMTGSLNMQDVTVRLADAPARPVALAFGAFALGFLTKAALFPFHLWLPDAHSAAPAPVSAVLSGLVIKTGIIGMIRTYQLFAEADALDLAAFHAGLAALGAFAIVFGSLAALVQDDIKMMLAYSTVTNVGYIAVGLALANVSGGVGATVHILNHSIIKSALFLGAGAIIFRTGRRTLSDLRGVGRSMPVTAGALSLAVIAVAGIPPTGGFVTKWYLAVGAIEAARPVLAAVLVFSALVALVYYLRMLNSFFFQPAVHPEVEQATEPPLGMLVPVIVLAAASLAIGLLAQYPVRLVTPGVVQLLGGG